jgi:tetratricopeptide (TPR) repeat protein
LRTFGELLTEHMRRIGISDSELARTLGVRRQTIFRWKEGLVERPRHRDDILLIVKKLRLTPEERDELLLAAGFAPETPETIAQVSPAPTIQAEMPNVISRSEPARSEAETLASDEKSPHVAPEISRSARNDMLRRLSPLALSAIILAILAVTLIVTLVIRQPNNNLAYPIASPGQSLIIVAPLVGSTSSTPIEMPIRPLPDTTPSATNINSRIHAALDRELQAARLDDAHVEMWLAEIRDANSANDALRRSNARIVIWGKYENGNILARLAIVPAASRADDLPLDALVATPADIEIKIDGASTEGIRTLALVALSQLYVDRGEFDLARATLTQASARPFANQAAFFVYSGYVSQVSKPPDLVQAIQAYSRTVELAPDMTVAYLNRGVAYVRQNNPQWQADFVRALANNSDDSHIRLAYCWALALDKQPQQALPHCDAAIGRDNSGHIHDARAIAYAQLGRAQDAANDLQRFLGWLAKQSPALQARYGTSRADWLSALKAGQNPVDPTTLDKLRRE